MVWRYLKIDTIRRMLMVQITRQTNFCRGNMLPKQIMYTTFLF